MGQASSELRARSAGASPSDPSAHSLMTTLYQPLQDGPGRGLAVLPEAAVEVGGVALTCPGRLR